MNFIRIFLVASVVLFLIPWLASDAYGTSGSFSNETVQVVAAEPSATPKAPLFEKTVGGVTPGDLFYIDVTDNSRDINVSLYITNSHELTPYLRYLILEVCIYFEDSDGEWRKASMQDGEPFPDTYITLHNSPVKMVLTGYKKYKIKVDSGSFYCMSTSSDGKNLSPRFYLTVEPV